jgi:hypothetical protein
MKGSGVKLFFLVLFLSCLEVGKKIAVYAEQLIRFFMKVIQLT